MGRKRAHEEDFTQYNNDDITCLDDSELIEPPRTKKSKTENSVADKIDVWVIKKPKNVSALLRRNLAGF